MPDQKPDEVAIFAAASKLPADAQSAFLAEACQRDDELRERLGRYLRCEREAGPLDAGLPEIAATVQRSEVGERIGTQLGPYKLREQIGEGGFGVVYVAEQQKPVARKVALKIIKPGMDTKDVIARFEAERQALALMDHPNVAKVLDAGATESGRPYFVMELVPGLPITEFCDEQKLTNHERLLLFIDVCRAVQHAHQRGIIHRDLKPSNILVTLDDGRPLPKVIDFGVSKALSCKLTEKSIYTAYGQMVGTPLYMAPEQATLSLHDVDTRSDVYSLGVLLYELLTGTTPFDKDALKEAGFDELRRIIREDEPPRPSDRVSTLNAEFLSTACDRRSVDRRTLGPSLKGELDWIVMKALEKDRNRRYETASAFATDIQHFLNDEAVRACPPSRMYKLRKFVRRNKATLATTTLIALSLIIGSSVAIWQAAQATRERDRAIAAEKGAETEAAISAAVNEFLKHDLLGMIDAESQLEELHTPDPDIKLRTVLDRAAIGVESRFADQPLVEASIQHSIANAYYSLGNYQRAELHYKRAFELRSELLGDEHPQTLGVATSLACACWRQCHWNEAEQLLRQSLKARQRVLGKEHLSTLATMNNLAGVLGDQGRYREAEQLHRQKLHIVMKTLGSEHPSTLKSMANLGVVCHELGRNNEAESLLQQALTTQLQLRGDAHPETLRIMCMLGNVYLSQGRLARAEQLQRDALEKRRHVLGDEHPDTIASKTCLACVLCEQLKFEEAERLLSETLDKRQRTLANDAPDTLRNMSNLAIACLGLYRYAQAEQLLQEALDAQQRVLGGDHPDTLCSRENLAICYAAQRRFDAAARNFQQTLEARQRVQGDRHPDTLRTTYHLAKVRDGQKRYEEAATLLIRATECQQLVLGEEHPDTLDSMHDLAGLYCDRQQRYEEAERLFLKTLEARERVLGEDHPDTLRTMHNLGLVRAHQGQHSEAQALLTKSLERRRVILGDDHPDTIASMNDLAAVHLQRGRHSDAKELLIRVVEHRRRVLGESHGDTLLSMANLATCHDKEAWQSRQAKQWHEMQLHWQSAAEIREAILKNPNIQCLENDVRKALRLNCCNLGLSHRKRSEYDQALPYCERALQLDRDLLAAKPGNDEYQKFLAIDMQALASVCREVACQLVAARNPAPQSIERATELARRAIDLQPEDAQHWRALGFALYRGGDYEAAQRALHQAEMKRRAGDQEYRVFLAMTYWQVGRHDEAVDIILDVAKWLAKQRRGVGQYAFFDEALQTLASGSPNGIDLALEVISREVEAKAHDRVLRLVRARLHAENQAWDRAAQDWVLVIDRSNHTRDYNSPRINACRELAAWPEIFARVVKLRPDESALWLGRGQYRSFQCQWADALEDYTRANPVGPITDATFEYAGLLLLAGDTAGYYRLCDACRKNLADQPGPFDTYLLARVFGIAPTSNIEPTRIVEWASAGLAQSRRASEMHVLGLAYYQAGDLEQSLAALQESNAGEWTELAKTQNALVLAMVHHSAGRHIEAREWLQLARATIDQKRAMSLKARLNFAAPDWIALELMHREAEKKIKAPETSTAKRREE